MIELIFVLMCTCWGLMLGSVLVVTLTTVGRLVDVLLPSSSPLSRFAAHWMAACTSLVALHIEYVNEDVIGRHPFAALGFYAGVAVAFGLRPAQWRAILRQLG